MIADDALIDKMTSAQEITNDLSNEQKLIAKTAKYTARKPGTYNLNAANRKRKENIDKQELIEHLKMSLDTCACDSITVTNKEREIDFLFNGVQYKLVLSAPRG